MARNKATQPNIDNSNPADYPDGRIRNNDGSGNGTPVNEQVYGDIHEFHAKIMRDAKEPYNGLPDNNTNGYQLYNAFMELAGKNDLIRNIVKTNATTLTIPCKVSALKLEEAITFKTDFDSVGTLNTIIGNDAASKPLTIVGGWKAGQFVRIINYSNAINITGLYDSQTVPNLAETITTITNTFTSWTKIMSVFIANGAMVFWNKPAVDIPAGWREVEDWRGRFPVGMNVLEAEFNVLGKMGGEKTHKLTEAEMPRHRHFGQSMQYAEAFKGQGFRPDEYNNEDGWTDYTGGDLPHNNLPPYRTVLFIEYIG
jgi:hypothetical protein